jgi:hypothetical protein
VIRKFVGRVDLGLAPGERERALRVLARVRANAQGRRVRVDSAVLIREERDGCRPLGSCFGDVSIR